MCINTVTATLSQNFFYTKPRPCIHIYVLHQYQHNIKHKQHKNDESILCNKSCDKDKVNLGQVTFSEDIGLTASQSCRENSCFSVCIHALNDGIVTGDCPVLCCAVRNYARLMSSTNAMLLYVRS